LLGTVATIGVAAAALSCSEHPEEYLLLPRCSFQFTVFPFAAMALLFHGVWLGWGISCNSL